MEQVQGVPYQPIPIVAEAPPYAAGQPPVGFQTRRVGLLRRWHKHWACICGNCDGMGVSSCVLGWFLPCVAFGMNRRRAFSQPALLWGLLFFLLMLLSPSCPAHITSEVLGLEDEENGLLCAQTILSLWVTVQAASTITIVAGIALIVLGTMNRQDLRRKFGLEGHPCTDCLLWTFCQPCALSQETRTLWHNSVRDGMWRGPPQVYVPPYDDHLPVSGTPAQGPAMTVPAPAIAPGGAPGIPQQFPNYPSAPPAPPAAPPTCQPFPGSLPTV
eukprot:evm.model.scf_1302.4 EVM.evm.TU.scf_1302.4   scf_1302:14320-16061(+)